MAGLLDTTPAHVEPTPATRPLGAPKRASLLGPALATVAFSVVFVLRAAVSYGGTTYYTLFDDAMISMRYAHNLASGHGLVWNPGGAHVEGYTNLLWTLWMAALHLTGVPESKIALLVVSSCVVLLLVNLWLVRALCERVAPQRPEAATAALWLTATAYPLLYWTLRGMEVGLLAVLSSAMALFVLRWRASQSNRDLWALALLGTLAVLTRSDAVIPAGTAAAFAVVWAHRRARAKAVLTLGGALAATIAANTAFRWFYYSDILPNTYYLKLAGAPLAARLSRGLTTVAVLATASLLPALFLAGVHLLLRRRLEPGVALLLALFATPAAYTIYVGGDAWEWMQFADRYLATGLTLLLVVAGIGLSDLARTSARTRARALVVGAALLVGGLVIAGTEAISTKSLQYSLSSTGQLPIREGLMALALILGALGAMRAARSEAGHFGVLAGVAAAAILMSGQGLTTWYVEGGLHIADDNTMAIYGLEIRAATHPGAQIAVVWAGAGPYFSHRPGIDLLGKSDVHVAKEAMRPGIGFYPGHTKWDYAWSIGHLRPDLVAGLVRPTPGELAAMAGWGYDKLVPGVWARRDSTMVDRQTLLTSLQRTPRVTALVARDL